MLPREGGIVLNRRFVCFMILILLMGTAALALETGLHPGALKDQVCSPAGSTIQGVRALEAGGFRSAAFEAVVAAYEKTLEMGRR